MNATDDLNWIKFGEGSYLCRSCREQFRTAGDSLTHKADAHPDQLWTMVSAVEVRNASYDVRIIDGRDGGGTVAMFIKGRLHDSGYDSMDHALACFADLVSLGQVTPK